MARRPRRGGGVTIGIDSPARRAGNRKGCAMRTPASSATEPPDPLVGWLVRAARHILAQSTPHGGVGRATAPPADGADRLGPAAERPSERTGDATLAPGEGRTAGAP